MVVFKGRVSGRSTRLQCATLVNVGQHIGLSGLLKEKKEQVKEGVGEWEEGLGGFSGGGGMDLV